MITKILGSRRGIATIINRRYYGKLLTSVCSNGRGSQVEFTPRRFYRCDAHMNELPVPCGPWDPWYSEKQSVYNKVLFGGIVWWLFSLFMMIYTDSIFLNWGPPKQPGPPSDMIEECDDSEL